MKYKFGDIVLASIFVDEPERVAVVAQYDENYKHYYLKFLHEDAMSLQYYFENELSSLPDPSNIFKEMLKK